MIQTLRINEVDNDPNRRWHPRFDIGSSGSISWLSADSEKCTADCHVRDISAGGMGLVVPTPLPVGQSVLVSIQQGTYFTIVRHCSPYGRDFVAGVQIVSERLLEVHEQRKEDIRKLRVERDHTEKERLAAKARIAEIGRKLMKLGSILVRYAGDGDRLEIDAVIRDLSGHIEHSHIMDILVEYDRLTTKVSDSQDSLRAMGIEG